MEAVATLDEADGSRVSTSSAIDNAREILGDAYGPTFEDDVAGYLGVDADDDDADGGGVDEDNETN